MGAVGFFIRSVILTGVLVMLLQIRWEGTTLEAHTMNFFRSGALAQPVDQTASGLVVLIRNSWSKMTSAINTNFSNALRRENQPGGRLEKFSVERSEEAMKEFKKKAAAASQRAKRQFIDETIVPEVTGPQADKSLAKSVDDEE
jgi:hypothetical protein